MGEASHAADRPTKGVLNRTLLARQGLISPLGAPLVEAVEAVGAIQAQYWPAVQVALWSRTRGFDSGQLHRALEARELVFGTLIRGTLHVVSARQHPYYAAVAQGSGVLGWRRTTAEAPGEMAELRSELRSFAESVPRTPAEMVEFIESWIQARRLTLDEKELAFQRSFRWRPVLTASEFTRVPADGNWEAGRTPAAYLAAPSRAGLATEQALDAVVRWHLSAFGPAAAEDVASWIGWRTAPVRAVLEQLSPPLLRFRDESNRTLYDLADASRLACHAPAPVRFLPWFDSTLLAYASGRRGRILPDAFRDRVYVRANGQILATFLVDGLVAGTWSVDGERQAILSLRPFGRLAEAARSSLVDRAEQLLRLLRPAATAYAVLLDD